MLTYKKVFEETGRIRFEFYPNGDESAPGIVEFEEGLPPKIIRHAEKDEKMYFGIHALAGIDPTKESGTVAWY